MPWLNEPGYATHVHSPQAQAHKLQIQAKTVRYAMIGWIMKIQQVAEQKVHADVWYTIAEVYWKYNKHDVLDTVEQWSTQNPLIKAYNKIVLSSLSLFADDPDQAYHRGPAVAPLATDDLLQTLRELLKIEKSQDANPQAQGSSRAGTTGESSASKGDTHKGKRKVSTDSENSKSGPSKRKKAKGIEDGTELDDIDYESGLDSAEYDGNYTTSGLPPGGGVLDDKIHSEAMYLAMAPLQEVEVTWVYTGGRSLKDVRAACKDFGITAARSIAETITRIENYVNEEMGGSLDVQLMVKHGKLDGEGADFFDDF